MPDYSPFFLKAILYIVLIMGTFFVFKVYEKYLAEKIDDLEVDIEKRENYMKIWINLPKFSIIVIGIELIIFILFFLIIPLIKLG